jgi:hypothetical protein
MSLRAKVLVVSRPLSWIPQVILALPARKDDVISDDRQLPANEAEALAERFNCRFLADDAPY